MKIFWTEGSQTTYLGKVMDNWDFCNYSFSVKDENHNTIYYVEANCCQCGFWFKGCPCKKCEKVIFEMWYGDKKEKIPVPLLKVGKKSCAKNMLGDADNFSVPFPKGATFRDRALLLGLVLLIDYRLFEEGGGQQQGGGRHRGY